MSSCETSIINYVTIQSTYHAVVKLSLDYLDLHRVKVKQVYAVSDLNQLAFDVVHLWFKVHRTLEAAEHDHHFSIVFLKHVKRCITWISNHLWMCDCHCQQVPYVSFHLIFKLGHTGRTVLERCWSGEQNSSPR